MKHEGSMRIPLALKTCRFYVATSMSKAFSSWPTFTEALDSFMRLKVTDEGASAAVIGIVEVNGDTTTLWEVRTP